MRAKAAARTKKMRENLTEEERQEIRAQYRARKARKMMEEQRRRNDQERRKKKENQVVGAAEKKGGLENHIVRATENRQVDEGRLVGENMETGEFRIMAKTGRAEERELDSKIVPAFDLTDNVSKDISDQRKDKENELSAMVSAAFGVVSGDIHWWQCLREKQSTT